MFFKIQFLLVQLLDVSAKMEENRALGVELYLMTLELEQCAARQPELLAANTRAPPVRQIGHSSAHAGHPFAGIDAATERATTATFRTDPGDGAAFR